MPDRIIREQARRSSTLRELSDAAERAWWRLTTACDDHGRFDADAEVLLAQLFNRRPRGWNKGKMARAIMEWESVGLIHLYSNGHLGSLYGHVPSWFEHQRQRESKPKFPEPPCGDSPQHAAKCGDSPLARARSVSESRESRDERRESEAGAASGESPPASAPPAFQIPESIRTALGRCPAFTGVPKLQAPPFWQAQIRAHPGVDFARELVKAQAWLAANPKKAPKSDIPAFLHRWCKKAAEDLNG